MSDMIGKNDIYGASRAGYPGKELGDYRVTRCIRGVLKKQQRHFDVRDVPFRMTVLVFG